MENMLHFSGHADKLKKDRDGGQKNQSNIKDIKGKTELISLLRGGNHAENPPL